MIVDRVGEADGPVLRSRQFYRQSARILSARCVIDFLGKIFSSFEHLAADTRWKKIEAIGDAYMAADGIPEPQADHAVMFRACSARCSTVEAIAGATHLKLRPGSAFTPARSLPASSTRTKSPTTSGRYGEYHKPHRIALLTRAFKSRRHAHPIRRYASILKNTAPSKLKARG